jgi:hypothetical protein
MKTLFPLSLGCLFALLPVPCRAAPIVVYDNFGPGQTYDTTGAYSVTGAAVPRLGQGEEALSFTPASTVTLHSLLLPLTYLTGTNSLLVSLRADAGGQPAPTALESFTFTGLPTFFNSAVVEADSTLDPLLQAGLTYWVTVFPGAADTGGGWLLNSTGAVGRSFSSDGSTWTSTPTNTSPALEVLGDPAAVPEPPTLALLLLLGVGVAATAWWQGRRSGVRPAPTGGPG